MESTPGLNRSPQRPYIPEILGGCFGQGTVGRVDDVVSAAQSRELRLKVLDLPVEPSQLGSLAALDSGTPIGRWRVRINRRRERILVVVPADHLHEQRQQRPELNADGPGS